MAEHDAGEKTEAATPKRKQDARKKGQVVRSKEWVTATIMIGGALFMMLFGGHVGREMERITRDVIRSAGEGIDTPRLMLATLSEAGLDATLALLPFLVGLFAISLFAPIVVGGATFSTEAMMPKWSRLSPASGFKRMFGIQALVELLKAIGKFFIVAGVAALTLWTFFDEFLTLGRGDVHATISGGMFLLMQTFLLISISLLLIVAIDLPYQIWHYAKELRMSKQEVKDEYKEMEGKPEVKGRIRRLQRELAQRRMMEEIPKADVVITNPTHFAVALKYDAERPGAPRVVAKGADLIALQIRRVADANQVYVVEAPPLARALYHTTELDREIPEGLFLAVAQVLAYVYSIRKYGRAATKPLPTEFPIPDEMKF